MRFNISLIRLFVIISVIALPALVYSQATSDSVHLNAAGSRLNTDDDTDSDEIDEMIMQNWETRQIFAYRNVTEIPDSIWLYLVDSLHGFALPVDGKVLNGFGPRGRRFHKGVDIKLSKGDPVKAAFDGVVRIALSGRRGFGKLVVIRHYNGFETYYAHLSQILVQAGDKVKAGDVIGLGGSTGRSRGPHLHFEMRYYDQAVDPEKLICFETGSLKQSCVYMTREFLKTRTRMTAKSAPTESLVGATESYYTVRKGDTLAKIARKYGTTIGALARLNNMHPQKKLRVGQLIRVI
ncbi:MAG: peptidoglycan DD-metalloendopeptidase family protein [Bacteroidales bacterium]